MSKTLEIKSLVSSFYSFLKNPKHEIPKSEEKKKIWTVFRLWSFILFVIIVTGIPVTMLINFSEYDQAQNLIIDLNCTCIRLNKILSCFRIGFICSNKSIHFFNSVGNISPATKFYDRIKSPTRPETEP